MNPFEERSPNFDLNNTKNQFLESISKIESLKRDFDVQNIELIMDELMKIVENICAESKDDKELLQAKIAFFFDSLMEFCLKNGSTMREIKKLFEKYFLTAIYRHI